MPMFEVSYLPYLNGVNTAQVFDHNIEQFNSRYSPSCRLYLTCSRGNLGQEQSAAFFALIDTLSAQIDRIDNITKASPLIMQRAIAYSVTQDYPSAINDLTVLLSGDSTSVLANWQRAVCQAKMNEYNSTAGNDVHLQTLRASDDMTAAINADPRNQYLHYDRGCMNAAMRKYEAAIADFTQAIDIDPFFAEAYYNRGIAYMDAGNIQAATQDLSKAGELGIYDAYSIIKRMTADKKGD